MAAISLVYFTAAGSEVWTELPIDGDCSTFYLPDNPVEDPLTVSPSIDERHSNICLEVHRTFVLLRRFNTTAGPCRVLGDGGINIELPLSTASHHKSIILATDVHFLAPSGRWGLRWGVVNGTGSNSMRPPPLPPVTECAETALVAEKEFEEQVEVKAVAEKAASQDQTGDSTCSPTPSPENDGSRDDIRTKESERVKEVSGDTDVPGTAARHEPGAGKSVSTVVEKFSAHDHHPQSTEGTVDAPSYSLATQEPFRGKDDATALSASERRRGKRKLAEVGIAESSLELANSQSAISDGGASTDCGTASINSQKKAQTGTRKTHGTKMSNEGSKFRGALTGTNASPQNSLPNEHPSSKGRMTRRKELTSPRDHSIAVAPVVIFSGSTSIQERGIAMQTFQRLGGKVSTEISKSTILCIPEGPLKKTGKLIMAVAMGMDIVTEKWIADAHRLGRFPEIEDYLPVDRSRERQWGFNLKDALGRGKAGLTHLLSGTTVFLTKQLRIDLGNLEREISQIATILGADTVKHRLPALKDKSKFSEAEILFIGMPGDPQCAHVEKLGQTLFSKDILTAAALRGRVERDSAEFRIEVSIKDGVADV